MKLDLKYRGLVNFDFLKGILWCQHFYFIINQLAYSNAISSVLRRQYAPCIEKTSIKHRKKTIVAAAILTISWRHCGKPCIICWRWNKVGITVSSINVYNNTYTNKYRYIHTSLLIFKRPTSHCKEGGVCVAEIWRTHTGQHTTHCTLLNNTTLHLQLVIMTVYMILRFTNLGIFCFMKLFIE